MNKLPPAPRLLIEGDVAAAAPYVGLAKKLARQCYASGIRAKSYAVAVGTVIRVENYPESHLSKVWITARGGGDYYQFIGTGPWRYQDYLDESVLPKVRYVPRVYAVLGKLARSGWTARPLVTSLDASPEAGWTFDGNPLRTNDHLYLKPAHQPDGMGLSPFFTPTEDQPDKAYPWLGTQWSQALPCHALARWSAGAVGGGFAPADTDFDYPPVLFAAGSPRTGSLKRPDTDWPQRGCLRVVDGRTFVVMTDANSVFHCFPLGVETGDGVEAPNIPEAFVQSVACPWPAWVTAEPLGQAVEEAQITRLRPRWVFSQDGTRAACVAAQRAEPWADATYTSSVYASNGTYQYDVREDYPGIVEVALALTVDGENPEDFTFGVTVRQTIYCLETGRYPLAVGYALRAMGEQIPLDALLVLEYQFHTNNPGMSAAIDPLVEIYPVSPTVAPESGWKMPERPAFAAVAVVSAQTELGGAWTEVRRWLAYYCAYPTRKTYGLNRKEPRPFYPHLEEIPGASAESDWYDNHFEFITQLASVNLSSMAFCLSATLATYGGALPSNTAYACDAATTEVIVWNELKETVSVGYDFLKPVVNHYLHLTAGFPDLDATTRIYPGATLDYEHYGLVQHSSGLGDFEAATLVVRDGRIGGESAWSSVLARGYAVAALGPGEFSHYFGDVSYGSFAGCPLFAGYARVYLPWVYLFFDTAPIVRPGFRWTRETGRDIASSAWEAGSPSFTGFPYGITLANKIYNLTVTALGNVNANLHTHVDGSWSIFYGPFACQSVVVNYASGIPLAHEQGLIDKIVLVRKESEHATTHINLLNQAFDKHWTESDYYFSFRKVGSQLQFNPGITYPTDLGWFNVTNIPMGVVFAFEGIVGMYLALTTAFNDFMAIDYTHGSPVRYSFPNPRLESLFLGRTRP